jgi:Flp pilus assembly protein TadG
VTPLVRARWGMPSGQIECATGRRNGSGQASQTSPNAPDERGNAIVEFIFVAVVVLIPLVYLIVAVATVQCARLSVTNAARDVGRAIATTQPGSDIDARARAALRIALGNQGFRSADVQLRLVAVHADCASAAIAADFSPGSEFQVCVVRHLRLPAVPSLVSGRGITTIGVFVVHLDEYRSTK